MEIFGYRKLIAYQKAKGLTWFTVNTTVIQPWL